MKRLSTGDLTLLLSAVEKLNSDFDPRTLPKRALAAASQVIAADSAAFTGFSFNGKFEGLTWENSGVISAEDLEMFARYIHEQPLIDALIIKRRTETLKITDLMPAREFQRTNIYNEFYRRVGVTNQLVAPLIVSDDLMMSCSINTIKEDFSERDRLILSMIAPHFANAVRNALAYDRLSSALEKKECGIISLGSHGKTVFVSEFAGKLLADYFAGEKRAANSLPESLANWLSEADLISITSGFNFPVAPLKIEHRNGLLSVRLMSGGATGEKTLLLEEKKLFSAANFKNLKITNREAEILFLIVQGKTDDVISMLCGISLRTVHKHVEHIYEKLGVETRTGAMLRVLEILEQSV